MHRAIYLGDNNYDKILANWKNSIESYLTLVSTFVSWLFPFLMPSFLRIWQQKSAMKWLWDFYVWFLSFSSSKYQQSNWEREEMNFKNLISPQALLWKNKLETISAMHSQRSKLKWYQLTFTTWSCQRFARYLHNRPAGRSWHWTLTGDIISLDMQNY